MSRQHNVVIVGLFFFVVVVFSEASGQPNLTNGWSAYYSFNAGTAVDDSGNGLNGAVSGGVSPTNGWVDNALYFNGTTGNIDFGNFANIPEVTVAAFVQPSPDLFVTQSSGGRIVDRWYNGENFLLGAGLAGTNGAVFYAAFHPRLTEFEAYPEIWAFSKTHPDSAQFYHVALTYNGTTLKLYVNGVVEAQVDRTNGTYSAVPSSPRLSIGSRAGVSDFFKGTIDEVRLYNRALTSNEVMQLTLPVVVQAQFNYSTNNGTITITGYTGSGRSVNVPSAINGLPVTVIGANAFSMQPSLTAVTIPDTVASIGNSVFSQCSSLAAVLFQGNAPAVGSSVFQSANNVTVYYLSGTTGWGTTFSGRPATLWDSLVPFTYTTNSGTITITGYLGGQSVATVPSTINGLPVTKIADSLFESYADLANIVLPSTLTNIGVFAFFRCAGLASVTIPNSVINIGAYAFRGCTSLSSITVGTSNPVYSSVDGVLCDKNQTTIIQCPAGKAGNYSIPSSITNIGSFAFEDCSALTSVTIPSSVSSIGNNAFEHCSSLAGVTIPNSVTSIGSAAFWRCTSLISITVEASNPVYSSVEGVLCDKNQSTIIQCPAGKAGNYAITNGFARLSDQAFYYCKNLTSITIPNSVTNIGNATFSSCQNLTSVKIGSGVSSIGGNAFLNCASLAAIFFSGNAPAIGAAVFLGANNVTVYYLPGTTGWGPTFGGRPAVLFNPDDTDGDGMPDTWEIAHGLNPYFNDANDDLDGDGVSNITEYINHLDPTRAFSDGITSDFQIVNGYRRETRYSYDKTDRLIGADYGNGLSIAYSYDGNGNILRQTHLMQDTNNFLPILWRFLNGLTNGTQSAPYEDADSDGWSNYQEWKACTSPTNGTSRPGLLDNPGVNIGSLALPFTPSNFVVGVGQLDGSGTETVVVGADGEPGTNRNFFVVLTQASSTWSTQRVDVGQYGLTSIVVGRLTNRPNAGIYAGLRGTTNGSGRVMEFLHSNGAWTSSVVTVSTNAAAFVLGIPTPADLFVSLAKMNEPDGALFVANFSTNWNLALVDTNASHRGLGTPFEPYLQTASATPMRLLDAGGIAVPGSTANSAWSLNLVSFWKLDGNSQDAVTSNNGTDNAVTYSSANGKINQGAGFNGSTSVIRTATNLTFADLTFSAWIKTTASAGEIVAEDSSSGQYVARMDVNSHKLTFGVYLTGTGVIKNVQGSTTIDDGNWHFVVATRSGGEYKVYVDGNLDGQTAGSSPSTANIPLVIGAERYEGVLYAVMNGAIDEVAIWSRALSAAEVSHLFGNGYGVAYSTGLLLPEPATSRRYLWRGRSLATGFLRLGETNGASILYVFGDDINGNDRLDFGDDFVNAEYSLTGTNSTFLTLSRSRAASSSTAQSYGLASVNFLNSSNEVFFTGEPDGQIFVWRANGSTNALQRQLFSGQYAGQAWHAMAPVKTLENGEGLLGLLVNPVTPNTCDVIFWPSQHHLPQATSFPQTAPLARVLPTPSSGGGLAKVQVRIWDGEGNASLPLLQYQIAGTTNWLDATVLKVGINNFSPTLRVPALPTGSTHELLWNVAGQLGAVRTNVFLRLRAMDVSLLGDWSEPMPFQIDSVDFDGDGVPDVWEIAAGLDPNRNGASEDPDNDGFSNFAEHIAGTNPNDPASYLRITLVKPVPGGVRIDWLGGTSGVQVLQGQLGLGTNWSDIFTTSSLPLGVRSFVSTNLPSTNIELFRVKLAP
jgi:YD repeat-containing protein